MSNARVQFTSRQLFAAMSLCCAVFALFAVEPQAGLFIAAAIVGIALGAFGVFRRRRSPIVAGLLLTTVSIGLLVYHGATVTTWVGRAKLPVHVLVIDTDTFEPVAGATIEVLNGPLSPIEGIVSPSWLSQFTPVTVEGEAAELVTDTRGECDFHHEFFAAGSDGLFSKSGYIRTGEFWLKATAPGHGSVMIPMDGQSMHARNIVDRSPLCVTVPLRKQDTD